MHTETLKIGDHQFTAMVSEEFPDNQITYVSYKRQPDGSLKPQVRQIVNIGKELKD